MGRFPGVALTLFADPGLLSFAPMEQVSLASCKDSASPVRGFRRPAPRNSRDALTPDQVAAGRVTPSATFTTSDRSQRTQSCPSRQPDAL